MPSLPLKVQVGVRDYWDKQDGSLQKALRALKDVLGYEVVVEPEWQLLVTELDKAYPDKTVFVPTIASFVETWCRKLTVLLEDEANEEWTESLLEWLKSTSRLRLFLEISSSGEPATSWSGERLAFVLWLPKGKVPQTSYLFHAFHDQLLSCFDETKPAVAALAHRQPPSGPSDDWADVEMDRATGKPAVVEKLSAAPPPSHPRGADILPNVSMLPRPDELLLKPPYHLILQDRGHNEIEVQCSHGPSLQVLADYFKRWCRVNHQDTRNPPAVEIKLHQSSFGLGLVYDRLVLSIENRYASAQFALTPTVLLALVEGILGYEQVSVDGHFWTYRRNVEFKAT